jgi:hypothetical protein
MNSSSMRIGLPLQQTLELASSIPPHSGRYDPTADLAPA